MFSVRIGRGKTMPERILVNTLFRFDEDALGLFHQCLEEVGGAISLEDLGKKFKERFGAWSKEWEEGFETNSDGLITGLEYQFQCKICHWESSNPEEISQCEAKGDKHQFPVNSTVEFGVGEQWFPASVIEVIFTYGDHKPCYTLLITDKKALKAIGRDGDESFKLSRQDEGLRPAKA
jgi:hypothetical protein